MTKEILIPKNESDAADIITAASASGETLAIEGGGTKRSLFEVSEGGRIISSRALTGITAYNPAELVMSVRAGTSLAEVEAELDRNGQRLAFEPMSYECLSMDDGEQTIGAVAAMNNSGPRRLAAGAARDSLLGVRFVNGRGEVVKNGGRVMKNVTGLDLVKLMAGSRGTLGFLTEVTFKVLPITETESTLALRDLDDEAAANALAHAMASSAEVSGAAHLPELTADRVAGGALGSEPATVIRVEGFAASVSHRIARLKGLFTGAAELQEIGEQQSRELWRDIREVMPFAGNDNALWRISAAPSRGHEVAMAIRTQAPAEVFYDWQGGLVWLQMQDGTHDDTVRGALAKYGGGHATLVRAHEAIRRSLPVFQPQNPAVEALTARVRAAFDPNGLFHPRQKQSSAA